MFVRTAVHHAFYLFVLCQGCKVTLACSETDTRSGHLFFALPISLLFLGLYLSTFLGSLYCPSFISDLSTVIFVFQFLHNSAHNSSIHTHSFTISLEMLCREILSYNLVCSHVGEVLVHAPTPRHSDSYLLHFVCMWVWTRGQRFQWDCTSHELASESCWQTTAIDVYIDLSKEGGGSFT
jgi:hypothetical protein